MAAMTLVVEMGFRLLLAEIVENGDGLMCPKVIKCAVTHPLIGAV
jgi:hypothetical protein